MSDWNTVYDTSNNIICTLRHGIAWSKSTGQRLGKYDHDFAYNNDGNVVAKISENRVLNIIGEELGYIVDKDIFVGSMKVGRFIGLPESALASIALLFNVGGTYDS